MKNNLAFRLNGNIAINADAVLKETSLIYLKEALLAQQYEECAGLIRDAKSFGAEQSEISAVIAEYNRGYTAGLDNEAKKINKGSRF